jgi:peptidoglycan/LPS O-acetylase OafA/YrhL
MFPPVSIRPRNAGHIPALDGLRGLAIAIVLIHNVGAYETTAPSMALKFLYIAHRLGWVGVQLFFVLSGFLITGILIDTKGSGGYWWSFYARRALRIFPLYYAVLFLWFVVAKHLFVLPHSVLDAHRHQVWFWTYLSNWTQPFGDVLGLSHFWSLAVEEQFYLVWPFVVMAFRPRALARACLAIAAFAIVFRIGIHFAHLPVLANYMFTFSRIDALVLGGLASVIIRDPVWLAKAQQYGRRVASGLGIVFALMVLGTRGFRSDGAFEQIVGYTVLAVTFAALVLWLAIEAERPRYRRADGASDTPLVRLLERPVLRTAGKYSYAIYVFHMPIAHFLAHWVSRPLNGPSPARDFVVLVGFEVVVAAASIVAALVSWHVLEKPCLALKDKIAPRGGGGGGSAPETEPEISPG